MHKRNKIKIVVAIAVALAFVMPVAAVANVGTIGITPNNKITGDMENIVENSTNSDTIETTIISDTSDIIRDTIETSINTEDLIIESRKETLFSDTMEASINAEQLVIEPRELGIDVEIFPPEVLELPDTTADASVIVSATGKTIYVDDDRPSEWYNETQVKTIHEGINNASAGDTVYVYNGTYYEGVVVDKQLINLVGESRKNTIIDGELRERVVKVIANGVNITSFTVKNGVRGICFYSTSNNWATDCDVLYAKSYGIVLSSTSNVNIVNCTSGYSNTCIILSSSPNSNNIMNCNFHHHGYASIYLSTTSNANIINCNSYNNSKGGYGVLHYRSPNNIFMNCDFSDSGMGIRIDSSSGCTFTNCNSYNNNYGVYIAYSSRNTKLRGNNIYNNAYNFYIYGSSLADFYQDINASNKVNGRPMYYLIEQSDITLDETDNFGYLGLISCTNIIAKNSDICGVLMANTTYSTISNVNSHNSGDGIYLWKSLYNNIMNCDSHDNRWSGIYLTDSPNNNIEGCILYDSHSLYGIRLDKSPNCNITNCDSYNNVRDGIHLEYSPHCNIINCDSYDNPWSGIHFKYSPNCNITNSASHDNGGGYFGIYACRSPNSNIMNCALYNNDYGIYVYGSPNSNITDCDSYNNYGSGGYGSGYGICLGSSDINVSNCNFYNNNYGIFIWPSSNNKLSGNIIYDNAYNFGIEGWDISEFDHDIDTSNTINGKPMYYLVGLKNITLDETDNFGYLALIGCTNITAKNTDVCGILLAGTTDSTISNVSSHNSADGIYIYDSPYSNIINCDLYDNYNGILIYSPHCNIGNCDSYDNYNGIVLWESPHSNITNCNSYNNSGDKYEGYGIWLDWSSDDNISNCNVYNNNYGIWLAGSSNCKLRDNTIHDNIYNFGITGQFSNDVDTSNTINGKPIWYLIEQSDITIDETNNFGYLGLISCNNITAKNSDVWGILLIDTTDSTISNVSSHNSIDGIHLYNSPNNNITNCNAYDNSGNGISLYNSPNSNITNCESYNNYDGIYFSDSPNSNIMNCDSYDNSGIGIFLGYSSNSNVINCTCYDNSFMGIRLYSLSSVNIINCIVYGSERGIELFWAYENNLIDCTSYNNTDKGWGGILIISSSDNSILNCKSYNNSGNGVDIHNKAHSNSITNSIFYNNEIGIQLSYECNGNLIHHNNFAGNGENAADSCSNTWDDGSEGNYWDDYEAKGGYDNDGDGIGDIPYDTGGNNQDNYPLMFPLDDIPPVISDVQATPSVQNMIVPVNITCTVTDNWDMVDMVKVNITGPEGLEAIMDVNESNYWYEDVYTTMGIYYYFIWANDTQGNIAVSDTYTFVITDIDTPISAVDSLPTWTAAVPFTVTATAYDNTFVVSVTLYYRCSDDGTDWTDWTFYGIDEEVPWSWLFTGSDGYYEFYSIAVDDYENVEDPPDVADASTGIDTTDPVTISILDPETPDGENRWYVSTVTVTLSATDELSGIDSTWYKLDSGYWKLYTTPFTVSSNGEHTVEAYSFDRAGNREDTKSVSFKIDKTLPVTEHEFDGIIGEDGWFVSDVTVTLSAEDITSGVNYTKCKLDDGEWTNYVDPFDVTENGEYTLYYYSVDLAGNTETTNEVEFKIEHDIPPPVTTHEFEGTIGDNGWFVSDVWVTLTAEDNAAGVDYTMYKIDDDDWIKKEYLGPFTFTIREDGYHTIEYYSVDKVGNVEDPHKFADFKIDQTVPTIELTWDKEDSKLVADVDDETSGVAKVEFYVNGKLLGEVTTAPYEWEVTKPKKGDKGQAIVFDNAGNNAVSPEINAVSQSQSQSSSSTPVPLQILSWLFGLW